MEIYLFIVLALFYLGFLAIIICYILDKKNIADKCEEYLGYIAFVTILVMIGYCIFNIILNQCIFLE